MKKLWTWGIGGAAIILLAFVGYQASYLHVRSLAVDQASSKAYQFLTALKAHQYKIAHTMLSLPKQKTMSAFAMQTMQRQIEKYHPLDFIPAGPTEYHPDDSLTNIELSWDVGSGQTAMPVDIEMIRDRDGWRVTDYHLNESPA